MKLRKLDMRGFSHDMALVAFVAVFAIIGVGYLVASHAETPNATLYRLYNGKDHFYTISTAEATSAEQSSGYRLEGTYPMYFENGTPSQAFYRSYNPTTGDHLYTATWSEVISAQSSGWNYEGVAWHFYRSNDPLPSGFCRSSWYRLYNGVDHFYTPDAKEVASAQQSGYTLEASNVFTTDRTCGTPVSSPVSAPTPPPSAKGEQLSRPPQRRPVQYVHVCNILASKTTYVSQGALNCWAGGTFQFNYAATVPGTYYNVPCQGIGTSPRYVYISSVEACPAGTTRVN
jgi:hypothetical protein